MEQMKSQLNNIKASSKMQALKNKKQTKPKHLRSHRTGKSEKEDGG